MEIQTLLFEIPKKKDQSVDKEEIWADISAGWNVRWVTQII